MVSPNSKINSNYLKTFDDSFGLDMVSFYIGNENVVGYFETSPIEQRIIKLLNYKPVVDNTTKSYLAHWMIYESKLYLGYVNGIINGKQFSTTKVVPEFPDDELLHFFTEFNGQVKFIVQQSEIPECFKPYLDDSGENMLLILKGD